MRSWWCTIWNDSEQSEKAARRIGWITVGIAGSSGISGLLRLIDPLQEIFTIVGALLAFVAALCGLLNRLLDQRKKTLETAAKKLPPELDVSIKTAEPSGELLVVIEPRNKVPFEYQWLIVTKKDVVVSGIMLDWGKVYPSKLDKKYVFDKAKFSMDRVVDNFVELRFKFRSVYAAEESDPNLSGKLIRPYLLSPDRRFCYPVEQR
jgi:hypothetical protein